MSTPLIIEAAINGATTKEQNANVPRAVNEIAACAFACIEAGAPGPPWVSRSCSPGDESIGYM